MCGACGIWAEVDGGSPVPNTALGTLVLEGVLAAAPIRELPTEGVLATAPIRELPTEGALATELPTELPTEGALPTELGRQGRGGDMRAHPGCSLPVAPGPEATLAPTLALGGAIGRRTALGAAIGGMSVGGSGR